MGYTFHQENQAWLGDADQEHKPEQTEGEGTPSDPTAMSGTLETSGTSGVTETAEDVSPVFDAADEQAAQNVNTEGELHRLGADDETESETSKRQAGQTGEENEAEAKQREAEAAANAEEQRNLAHGGQTTDTTGDSVLPVASEQDARDASAAQVSPDAGADAEAENKFDGRKNPDDFSVKEVKVYLATATDEQKAKVQAKEAEGQNRAGIMNF